MTKFTSMLGVILAGGQSRRMGRDKLFVELDGQHLISRAVQRLKQQMEHTVIVGPAKKRALAKQGTSLISDKHEGFQGPLAGIFAGLSNAEVHGFEGIITIAADTPFFPDDYVERIFGDPSVFILPDERRVKIARSPDGLHPVFGYWSLNAIDKILELMNNDVRKVMAAADAVGWDPVDFDSTGVDPFFNINTPEDLKQAKQILADENIRN